MDPRLCSCSAVPGTPRTQCSSCSAVVTALSLDGQYTGACVTPKPLSLLQQHRHAQFIRWAGTHPERFQCPETRVLQQTLQCPSKQVAQDHVVPGGPVACSARWEPVALLHCGCVQGSNVDEFGFLLIGCKMHCTQSDIEPYLLGHAFPVCTIFPCTACMRTRFLEQARQRRRHALHSGAQQCTLRRELRHNAGRRVRVHRDASRDGFCVKRPSLFPR